MKAQLKIPRRYFLGALAGVVAAAGIGFGLAYARFAADLERATQRVAHGSRIAATACGPIEYAEMGEGPAVLLVHGAGGGFDQGIEFGGELARQGYRVIAMSRSATPSARARCSCSSPSLTGRHRRRRTIPATPDCSDASCWSAP
jgi:hypothetical protein